MSEEEKKTQYINENIISKGYNLEELSKFVVNELQMTIDQLSLSTLKESIERFKSKGLTDIYQAVKEENKATEPSKENPTEMLYLPEHYVFTTKLQENNKLYQLEKEHKAINIVISEPKQEASTNTFFSKIKKFSYRLQCPQIKSDVRRNYDDIDWLREQLIKYYPLRYVTPLIKENSFIQLGIINKNDSDEEAENKKIHYLNKFFRALIQKKIFRTSPILLIFLEANDNVFQAYKDTLDNEKYVIKKNLENFKTLKGKLKIDFDKEKLNKTSHFDKNYTGLIENYNKVENCINVISNDFKNLTTHMRELSEQFENLAEILKFYNNGGRITTSYNQLSTIFTSWSSAYEHQNAFFNQDIKGEFKYIGLQLKEFDNMFKKFSDIKNRYETQGTKINKKKEELFIKKDFTKWGLEPGVEKEIVLFQNDRRKSFKLMMYKDTEALEEEKKILTLYMYYLNNEFDKLMKHQGEEIKFLFEHLKDNNQIVVGDAFNLIKLFSLCIE